MLLKIFKRRPKEDVFDVDTILIPVGDSKKFVERRTSLKDVDIETWKSTLELKNESLERENKRLKKYEVLVDALFERLSHDDEFMRKFRRFVDTNQPDMRVKSVKAS